MGSGEASGHDTQRGRRRSARGRGARQGRAYEVDTYRLYQDSVQDPAGDVSLIGRVYKRTFGRRPRTLREDFCGTAAMCCEWVKAHKKNRAVGVDLDPEPLEWGRLNNVAALSTDERGRVELLKGDVLEVDLEPADVIVAFNFSYFLFKTRDQLVRYFERARMGLAEEGLFVIDLYGGADAQRTLTETREHDDYDYVWDQDVFDPISHHAENYIHFVFPDGSRIDRAFSYDWRLWSIPEVREVLADAGFSSTQTYWERAGDDDDDEGSGIYYPADRAPDDPAWISYVVAVR